MAQDSATICIQCGNDTAQAEHLNRLADGSVCVACRDRLLETLPALLPGTPQRERFEAGEPDAADYRLGFRDAIGSDEPGDATDAQGEHPSD